MEHLHANDILTRVARYNLIPEPAPGLHRRPRSPARQAGGAIRGGPQPRQHHRQAGLPGCRPDRIRSPLRTASPRSKR
ncbi:MAG: hypothetical protein MZV70_60815 [Desulfobacterales bacterium]|nr:hypothetical protein [Desulfobacterales bacterium]